MLKYIAITTIKLSVLADCHSSEGSNEESPCATQCSITELLSKAHFNWFDVVSLTQDPRTDVVFESLLDGLSDDQRALLTAS